jgi:hypothetical protein
MQQRKMRSIYLFISSLVIALLSFPFAFAKKVENRSRQIVNTAIENSTNYLSALPPTIMSVYDSLQLNISGLNRKAFEMAEAGFQKLKGQGEFLNDSIISVIDFSLPSTEKRLYVVDLKNYRILFNTYVAHGRNSGTENATSFSNSPSSNKSSLGFYKTLGTYIGGHGYSLKLDGLERGINDNVYKRAIVMHGADYVNPSYFHSLGYLGRSQGCPAVMSKEAPKIINTIKNGTCLFIYHPTNAYQQRSSLV